MKRKLLLTALLAGTVGMGSYAQRAMDKLDRGLVAVNTGKGIFCSWRILGEEYYDVTYNIYRDGTKINSSPLRVSNFTDAAGTAGSSYAVEAVVRGKAEKKSKAVKPWAHNYMEIEPEKVYANKGGADITSHYEPNDVSVADLDGDGEVELLLKRRNIADANALYPITSTDFDILEAYKLNGKRLWWIDCGPNMVSGTSVEVNIVAYDWDGDGRAEVVLRGADGMVLHMADGTTQTIGNPAVNTRNTISHTPNMTYTNSGAEYLLYLNGETGKPYQVMDYPLSRGKATDWGDAYGHRSSKYFFGAPFLDGRKPSIFLARGIYTKHKMAAFDVDPATHTLTTRWTWNSPSSGIWFGQGYHNYGIADVDWDGRDEIVYGSMVIDDNGHGLSSTGLGHGDAQHCSDFNPFIHGQEIYACNEDLPNNNYRDATTSKIYYRSTSPNDDGRAMMANFTDRYPGAQGVSAHDDNVISSVTNKPLADGTKTGIDQSFAIYWDGDLLRETFNYEGFNAKGYYETGAPRVVKYGSWTPIERFEGCRTNNGTKGSPASQSDIMGDWREELILRTTDGKLRIYTTTAPTEYRNYTLWHDHQYRNAMVWEMCGYNQPPHTSYFLGKAEGITQAPPPLTMTGRTEVGNGGTVNGALADKQVLMAETADMTVSVEDGAAPYIFFDNAPTWVQGHDDNDNITTTTYTHRLTGGAFAGAMRLVKQGDGRLVLPKVTQRYTGPTDVWAGTLDFDGTLKNSRLWLNRFASLCSDGGVFKKGIEMDYGARLCPGSKDKAGTIATDSLIMNYGARMVIDLFSNGTSDHVKAKTLKLGKKVWENGPAYNTPVLEIVPHYATGTEKIPAGKYAIAEIERIEGDPADIVIEGFGTQKGELSYADGKLWLTVSDTRSPAAVTWKGAVNGNWDLASTENFTSTTTGEDNIFVSGDAVTFDDSAVKTDINLPADVYPRSVNFENETKHFTFSGAAIAGNTGLSKSGAGKVKLNNTNTFSGLVDINGGTLEVSALADADGVERGALGGKDNAIRLNGGGTLSIAKTTGMSHPIVAKSGAINVAAGATAAMHKASITGAGDLIKTGAGQLSLYSGNKIKRFYINAGKVFDEADAHAVGDTVIFNGTTGTLLFSNSIYSYNSDNTHFVVPAGKRGSIYLDGRCVYTGKLTGEGTLDVHSQFVRNTLQGDWSAFAGTLNAYQGSKSSFNFYHAKGLPNTVVSIMAGCTFKNTVEEKSTAVSNMKIGGLSGSGVLGGTGTYLVGMKDTATLFSGTIGNGINLIKTGPGTLTLMQPQTGMGTLTVEGGELVLRNNGTTTMTGTADMTVSGGRLSGYGCCGNPNVTVMAGATLAPGIAAKRITDGTLAFKGNLDMQQGSVAELKIYRKEKYGSIKVEGTFGLKGTVKVVFDEAYTPAVGDEFTLWTAGVMADAPTVTLPSLPAGMAWDKSGLSGSNVTTGVLKVVAATAGIENLADDEPVDCTLNTVDGKGIARFTTAKGRVEAYIHGMGLPAGHYLVVMSHGKARTAKKIQIR